jgi:hypothetical protein
MRDKVSLPYKTTGKIIVLYILKCKMHVKENLYKLLKEKSSHACLQHYEPALTK